MTKLPAALMREVKAEFKAQRESYISGYIEAHLSDVFSISDFYPVILTTLQQAILDGYTIADYNRQPFYNTGEPAIRIVLNRKQDEIEADRTALTTEAEAQLMASLMAQAEEYYTQAVAEDVRQPFTCRPRGHCEVRDRLCSFTMLRRETRRSSLRKAPAPIAR